MKSLNPTSSNHSNLSGALRVSQSVYKVLNQGLELAVPIGQDSTGVYNQFEPGNHAGVMVRICATGTPNVPYAWPGTAGFPLVINHGLLKQPLGFHVTDVDDAAKIYRVKNADLNSNVISLATDTPTCSATVFIF